MLAPKLLCECLVFIHLVDTEAEQIKVINGFNIQFSKICISFYVHFITGNWVKLKCWHDNVQKQLHTHRNFNSIVVTLCSYCGLWCSHFGIAHVVLWLIKNITRHFNCILQDIAGFALNVYFCVLPWAFLKICLSIFLANIH